ncbi:MAG: Gfo/Idh/MocA family oxidoreductase [Herbinix sp.]|nr:Gfo/Idh/MocA family oxidoreductase [Herbinix sp.]
MIRYGIIGSGWRSEFYIRIAKLVPERFNVTAVLIRDKEKGIIFERQFGIKVVNTLDELIEADMDFVVLSIKRGITSDYLLKLFERKIPVLCETPPGETLEALAGLWEQYIKFQPKIQIAEQYFLQPLYASWLKVIEDGRLGQVQNVNISSLHKIQ